MEVTDAGPSTSNPNPPHENGAQRALHCLRDACVGSPCYTKAVELISVGLSKLFRPEGHYAATAIQAMQHPDLLAKTNNLCPWARIAGYMARPPVPQGGETTRKREGAGDAAREEQEGPGLIVLFRVNSSEVRCATDDESTARRLSRSGFVALLTAIGWLCCDR